MRRCEKENTNYRYNVFNETKKSECYDFGRKTTRKAKQISTAVVQKRERATKWK
jgi:hypothetical protein